MPRLRVWRDRAEAEIEVRWIANGRTLLPGPSPSKGEGSNVVTMIEKHK